MKKMLALVLISSVGLLFGCSSGGEAPGGGGDTYNLTVNVDLGGAFDVTATARISTTGSTFTAVITTIKIGGADEAHTMTISGSVMGSTYTVVNQQFTITVGTTTETVVVNGSFTISGNSLTGSGTMTVDQGGAVGPMNGTFSAAGTKS